MSLHMELQSSVWNYIWVGLEIWIDSALSTFLYVIIYNFNNSNKRKSGWACIFLFYEEHVGQRGCVKLPWASHIFPWSFLSISHMYQLWCFWVFYGTLSRMSSYHEYAFIFYFVWCYFSRQKVEVMKVKMPIKMQN